MLYINIYFNNKRNLILGLKFGQISGIRLFSQITICYIPKLIYSVNILCFARLLGVKRLSKPDLYLSEQPTFSGNYAIIATVLQISLLPFLTPHQNLFYFFSRKKNRKKTFYSNYNFHGCFRKQRESFDLFCLRIPYHFNGLWLLGRQGRNEKTKQKTMGKYSHRKFAKICNCC